MSWARLHPHLQPGRVTGIALSIAREKQTKNSARMFLRVAPQVAEAAGIPIGERSRVDLFLGDGAEAGQMKIVPGPEGAYLCRPAKKGGALTIAAGVPEGFPRELRTHHCEMIDAGKGGIVFALPFAGSRQAQIIRKHLTDAGVDPEAFDEVAVSADEPNPAVRMTEAELVEGLDRIIKPPAAPPPAGVKDWCEQREVKAPPPKPRAMPSLPKPEQREAAPDPPRRTFAHGKEAVALSPWHYAIATKLKAGMGKGFIPYGDLMAAARGAGLKIGDVGSLQAYISTLRKQLWWLGLEICVVEKMGYYMREAGDRKTPAAAEEASLK